MIAIIPARSGSKGIPNKNIMDFNGKPLIYNTIKAAKNSNMIDRVFVSTDSKEIAEISMSYGAESPFLRPPELAEDTSLLNDTLKFMIQRLELTFAKALDSIIVLQPTSPLRNNDDIDNLKVNKSEKLTDQQDNKRRPRFDIRLKIIQPLNLQPVFVGKI